MSLRQIRKLRASRQGTPADPLQENPHSARSSESSGEESLRGSFPFPQSRPRSAFLAAAGDSEEDSEEDKGSEAPRPATGEETAAGRREADEKGKTAGGDASGRGQEAETDGDEIASREAAVGETSPPRRQKASSAGKRKRKKKTQLSPAREGAETSLTGPQGWQEKEKTRDFNSRANAADELGNRDSSTPHKPAGTYCLAMERAMFDTEVELKRIFGREVARNLAGNARHSQIVCVCGGNAGTRRAGPTSRRFWLIPDAEEGPATHEYVRMVKEDDEAAGTVEFALQYTPYYEQLQDAFHAILHSHDPQNLQQFLLRHPRHIDALLQMSEVYRMRGENETATELSKKALCVAVDTLNPFNKNLVKCIGLYGAALADQGCYRTALEVTKLLVAMDLPRDAFHAMLHLDYLALRSRQWQFLQHFSQTFVEQHLAYVIPLDPPSERGHQDSRETLVSRKDEDLKLVDLAFMLPNFAFSTALSIALHATQRECSEDIKTITADELLAVCMPSTRERQTGNESQLHHLLLMRAILLFPAFVRKLLQKIGVNGSQKVAEIKEFARRWSRSSFLFDVSRYKDVRVSEFDRIPTPPAFLMDAHHAVTEAGAGHRNRRVQYVSINSSPIIIFFETLLPWTELDQTGLRAEPQHVSVLARSLLSALCEIATFAWKAVQNLGPFIRRWLADSSPRTITRVPSSSDAPHVGNAPSVQN
ncbi:gh16169, related [Neospora caninum Liverpool]|uniref:Gh16169, related n=1 Tax=Neospora caninum (strain Liverpool) TaxID=572307 RepID=F0VC46_NEOCL|nr:gh16169, related [Neospora caninum Liverpool]CBZ51180.1 gh16169, related [Neospora caninum Liverpool]|eukprot:XP_003881213.1 gh16169, related [Neospora caninum Liverpool]